MDDVSIRQRVVDLYGDDIDRAHPLIGELLALAAERDRLRAEKAHLVEINGALRERPDLADRAPRIMAIVAERDGWRSENDRHRSLYVEAVRERDNLRAVVDGLPILVERTVRALQQTRGRELAADPDAIRDAVSAALAAIRSVGQLDVGGEAVDG